MKTNRPPSKLIYSILLKICKSSFGQNCLLSSILRYRIAIMELASHDSSPRQGELRLSLQAMTLKIKHFILNPKLKF